MKVQTVAQRWLFSTVRIEAAGPEKKSVGTGFVFAYELDTEEDNRPSYFMVTNKHVIEDAEEGSFVFIEKDGSQNPMLGQGIKVPIIGFNNVWHGHPDPDVDIAVSPLNSLIDLRVIAGDSATIGERTFVSAVPSGHIPTPSQIEDFDAVEDVFFIGYPQGLYDEENLTPIVRKGITATPLQIDYEGRPTFLIDAAVFPGSSGSPVFAATSGVRADRNGKLVLIASRMAFLGVIAEYLSVEREGRVEWKPIPTGIENEMVPTYTTSQALHLGLVYKASTVLETVKDFIHKFDAS